MTLRHTSRTKGQTVTVGAALVGAALTSTAWATPATPATSDAGGGGASGGSGRLFAEAVPAPADPGGPNSGAGRMPAAWLPSPTDPSGPNLGRATVLPDFWQPDTPRT